MKWIFVLFALVLVLGCLGESVDTGAAEGIADTHDELGPEDYTEVDALDEGTLGSEEELGSGLEEGEIF